MNDEKQPAAWKFVPTEPTQEMIDALWNALPKGFVFQNCTPRGVIASIIAASPAPSPVSGADERAAFEAWLTETDDYVSDAQWEAWQARAALAPTPTGQHTLSAAAAPQAVALTKKQRDALQAACVWVAADTIAGKTIREWIDSEASSAVLSGTREHCMCVACRDGVVHASDCAVHNEPAMPAGPCDCGVMCQDRGHGDCRYQTPQAVALRHDQRRAIEWAIDAAPEHAIHKAALLSLLAATPTPVTADASKQETAKISLYYMRDNHTFKRLEGSVEEMLAQCMEEYDTGETGGMLCTKSIPGIGNVHAGTDREHFKNSAHTWLAYALSRSDKS